MKLHGMRRRTAIGKSYLSLAAALALFAGYYYDSDLPCYWRDGTRVALPYDEGAGRVAAIAVNGGTVYTAGSTGYHDYYSCYWTGTTRTELEGSGAEGIDVAGGTVYTAGYHGYFDAPSSSYAYTACYWVDDDRYDLPGEGTNGAQAYAIRVFEGSIYVSGCYNDGTKDIPCYWEDGVRVALPGGTSDGYATDIVVVNEE